MKTVKATEAGRNFSAALKAADKNGLLNIDKKGGASYVLMSKAEYRQIAGRSMICGRRGKEIIRIELDTGRVRIYQILPDERGLVHYRKGDLPAGIVKISISGGKVSVEADLEDETGAGLEESRTVLFGTGLMDVDVEEAHADMDFAPDAARIGELRKVMSILDAAEEAAGTSLPEAILNIYGGRGSLMDEF